MADSSAPTKPDAEPTAVGAVTPTSQAMELGSSPVSAGKGKGKSTEEPEDVAMEEDDDDEEDDEEDDDDDDDEDEAEESLAEIDPSAIIASSGGRPRRNRQPVDYSSAEAHAKAGIDPTKEDDEE